MAVLGSNTLNHTDNLLIQRDASTKINVTNTGVVVTGIVTATTFDGALDGNAATATNATTATNCSRQIINGNGMNFTDGALTADRTITLGTPSTLTGSTANAVTASSHTHAITVNLGSTAGTTSGPVITCSAGTNVTIPSAGTGASGAVTTGTQTFGGEKRFNDGLRVGNSLRFFVSNADNALQCSNIFNNGTTSGSNVHVRATDFLMERNISSIKYKHSVETLDDDVSDYVIKNLRPVWYRSRCANDTPDWSWYGFIAEEVAEIEPRLCHWDVPIIEEETDEYYQPEPYTNEEGEVVTPDPVKIVRKYQDPNAPKEVEGVMYERFTVLLVDQVQKLIGRVDSLEEKLSNILSILENLNTN